MARFTNNLDPDRLVKAADASLKAGVEVAEYTGRASPYPPDLMGSPLQAGCLALFTKWEIQEAGAFLVRLGVLDRPRAQRRSSMG